METLGKSFFEQDVDTVAKNLLGSCLNFYNYKAIICETESYDENDPASHSFGGKITKRNQAMFASAGSIYVYLIYGMYYCLNLVTGKEGEGAAVLIRAVFLPKDNLFINGPGKVCKFLNITKEHNKLLVINNPNISVTQNTNISKKYTFTATTRIGITKGKDLLRRYLINNV